MKTIPRTWPPILSEDPGLRAASLVPDGPRRTLRRNKRLRTRRAIAAHLAIDAIATYVGNRTPPFAAAETLVDIERTRLETSLLATAVQDRGT